MQTNSQIEVAPAEQSLELAMQELETMDAPDWAPVASAIISLAGGISIGLAIT